MAHQPDPLGALTEIPPTPRSGDGWDEFVRTLQNVRSGKSGWPAEIAHIRRWYEPHLERTYEDASVRQADLQQLELERFRSDLNCDLGFRYTPDP
jgi:DNA helicase-2/ATP-dependent DNA helicase PcrA